MARRRFFVPEVRRGSAELSGHDAEHLVRVLRVEPGQVYELSDNQSVYLAEIEFARKSAVGFRILEKLPQPAPSVHITICAALIKFEHFEWLIEKVTELGAAVIQPIASIRAERGLAQASRKRSSRWERIALEASQQSRRAHLPEIAPVIGFNDALRSEADVRLLLDENPEAASILQVVPATRSTQDRVILLVGPEGGWTEEERQQALSANWSACSLGRNVLRAETAAISALAVIQAAWNAVIY
ncbi:MAG TPA: RsmE family RNA methyltransferase [Bryobacteraceae bacterium]|nr:RsmE family RNA methyltransferase [Bryobacteraceae bacterium]